MDRKLNNKSQWIDNILSKISTRAKTNILVFMIIALISMAYTIHENAECRNSSMFSDISSTIISKYPDMCVGKNELFDKYEKDIMKVQKVQKVKGDKKSFSSFLKDIAQKESKGRWDVSSNSGYLGLYQIGRLALEDVSQKTKNPELKGLHITIDKESFDENPNIFPPELQTKVFKQLLRNNKQYLKPYYKYIGKTVGGVEITESGILGGSHLVGHGGVKKFLKSGGAIDITDSNGVKCSEYLKKFSNYKIDLI